MGGVFAAGIGELLHRLDRLGQQVLFPAGQPGTGPVAVSTLHVRGAELGDFSEQRPGRPRLRVVGVDQHREPGNVGGHSRSYLIPNRSATGAGTSSSGLRATSKVVSAGRSASQPGRDRRLLSIKYSVVSSLSPARLSGNVAS